MKVIELIEQGMEKRLHTGAQLYASLRGQVVLDLALGEARPGVAMGRGTLMRWMSSGKPITAMAVAQQIERGTLGLDDRVVDHIPEFGQKGKESITVRHLLMHTGGFRTADFDPVADEWDMIIQRICATPIERNWTPGKRAGYHGMTSWFILGELVQRSSGEDFAGYVRRHILDPAGMVDSWVGMPAERYAAYGDRIGVHHDTRRGRIEAGPWHELASLGEPMPGGNAVGPVRELGRFYEMLLAGGRGATGKRIVSSQTAALFTARHREGKHDATFRATLDWGLGLMVNSARHGEADPPYGYGPYASADAFGHGGMQSSIGFADPAHGLAVAVVFNGLPGEPKHHRRMLAVVTALYAELGLANGG